MRGDERELVALVRNGRPAPARARVLPDELHPVLTVEVRSGFEVAERLECHARVAEPLDLLEQLVEQGPAEALAAEGRLEHEPAHAGLAVTLVCEPEAADDGSPLLDDPDALARTRVAVGRRVHHALGDLGPDGIG